jgi:mono/diheme cytochrome c family protein
VLKILLKSVWHLAALVGIATIAGAVWFWSQGIGTRTPPGAVESAVSRAARRAMIPATAKDRVNPESATSDTLRAGLEHWADHCASCHGNNGSGETETGQGLFPRPPDMRQSTTQELTDGELFYIIENGVKLTGMPAWGTGTPEGETASWHLVQFIRRLPTLSDAEILDMEEMNPRSFSEWRALEEERRFLAGEPPAPQAEPGPVHKHKGAPQ